MADQEDKIVTPTSPLSKPRFFSWSQFHRRSREAKEILRMVGRTSQNFGLIRPGDRILVACSGGKDSYTLAWALAQTQKRVPFSFELIALNIDQGFGAYDQETVVDFLTFQGLTVEGVRENTGMICRAKVGKDGNACWLCARLRRGILYSHARRLGCNKVALGHHADDLIETLLINQFFAGQIKSMPPWLRINEGDLEVIRPLARVPERTISAFAASLHFPIVPCSCPYDGNLVLSERAQVKSLLSELQQRIPDIKSNLLASLTRVRPSHLLDRTLFEFSGKSEIDTPGTED